jgi:radical SAM superfamily enzyme YgiQ (UPF0313 family)
MTDVLHQIASSQPQHDFRREREGLRVCLVTALTIEDFIDTELTASVRANRGVQLGVLTLAAILRERLYETHIVDLDDLFLRYLEQSSVSVCKSWNIGIVGDSTGVVKVPDQSFFSYAAAHIKRLGAEFDVYGFSSICSSYPLTLRLAEQVKNHVPSAVVLLGGPQASVVDVPTMKAFPHIDYVIRGEADETLPQVLMALSQRDDFDFSAIPGITFRRDNKIVRNPNRPVVRNLDVLPLPAFDLDPNIRNLSGIHLELGRGCPFACTFCSTNDFFRRNFRLKSPAKVIEHMRTIKAKYGVNFISLVHDMFTVDRKRVLAFCDALLKSGEKFSWGCSARTDCVDEALIQTMAQAGCRGMFYGIETGSVRMQKIINKRLDLVEAEWHIAVNDKHCINTAVALIVGFPEEERDDLRDTINFFVDSLRFDHAEPQISLLAPLAATPIYEEHKHELVFDNIFSDMSHQGWWQDPIEVQMIEDHPDIFPNFYAVPTQHASRAYLKELIDFVTYLATWFRWLPVGLLQDSGDFLEVFDQWRSWRANREGQETDEDIGDTPYYSHRRFRKEFLEFVSLSYLKNSAHAPVAVTALIEAEGIESRTSITITNPQNAASCRSGASPQNDNIYDMIPAPSRTVTVLTLSVNYKDLIERLRARQPLTTVENTPSTIALIPNDDKSVEVRQLTPLSAAMLRLCDGTRTIKEIVQEFDRQRLAFDNISSQAVCLFAIHQLQSQGLLEVAGQEAGDRRARNKAASVHRQVRQLAPLQATGTQQPWPPQLFP